MQSLFGQKHCIAFVNWPIKFCDRDLDQFLRLIIIIMSKKNSSTETSVFYLGSDLQTSKTFIITNISRKFKITYIDKSKSFLLIAGTFILKPMKITCSYNTV